MTDQTLSADMPSGGGAWIRLPDGSLALQEAPTALEAPPESPVESPVEAPVEAGVEAGVEPTFKSRRQPAPSPVKEA